MKSIEIVGDAELLRALEQLPQRAQQRILKPLLESAADRISAALRSEAPRGSGLLQQSLGESPLRKYRGGSLLMVAVGVRRGYRRAVEPKARGGLRIVSARRTPAAEAAGASVQNPTKYLHLVTGGRKAVQALRARALYDVRSGRFFGRQAQAAKPNPFVDRVFAAQSEAEARRVSLEASDAILDEAAGLLPKAH